MSITHVGPERRTSTCFPPVMRSGPFGFSLILWRSRRRPRCLCLKSLMHWEGPGRNKYCARVPNGIKTKHRKTALKRIRELPEGYSEGNHKAELTGKARERKLMRIRKSIHQIHLIQVLGRGGQRKNIPQYLSIVQLGRIRGGFHSKGYVKMVINFLVSFKISFVISFYEDCINIWKSYCNLVAFSQF